MGMEDILAIVPARGGSKGIPRKNLATVCGVPLVGRAVAAAREAGCDVVVSTDDDEIAEAGRAAGATAVLVRPAELATDQAGTLGVLQHAVRAFEGLRGHAISAVMTLQPTSPLRTGEDVREAGARFAKRPPDCRSLISVSQGSHLNPSILYSADPDGRGVPLAAAAAFSRQQEAQLLIRNGAIYIADRALIMDDGRVICDRPLLYRMPRWRGVNIDDYFELYLAQVLGEHPPSGAAAEA